MKAWDEIYDFQDLRDVEMDLYHMEFLAELFQHISDSAKENALGKIRLSASVADSGISAGKIFQIVLETKAGDGIQ